MRTIQRKIVGGYIFSSDGFILLGKTGKGGSYTGYSVIPGGGIDEGETKLATLKREIMEETGLDIEGSVIKYTGSVKTGLSEKTLSDTGERVKVEMSFYDFTVKLSKPAAELKLTPGDDFAEADWVRIDQLPKLKLSDAMNENLHELGYL